MLTLIAPFSDCLLTKTLVLQCFTEGNFSTSLGPMGSFITADYATAFDLPSLRNILQEHSKYMGSLHSIPLGGLDMVFLTHTINNESLLDALKTLSGIQGIETTASTDSYSRFLLLIKTPYQCKAIDKLTALLAVWNPCLQRIPGALPWAHYPQIKNLLPPHLLVLLTTSHHAVHPI